MLTIIKRELTHLNIINKSISFNKNKYIDRIHIEVNDQPAKK